MMKKSVTWLIVLTITMLAVTGCGGFNGQTPTSSSPAVSATPAPPTDTPEPLAANVSGEPIRLVDFEEEVARFEDAQLAAGIDLATLGNYREQILQALIDRQLLAQGARRSGVTISEGVLNARIENLAAELGGNELMGAWLAENGYSLESFKAALEVEMLAAEMVKQIVEAVPNSVEQIRARHVLVATREEAEQILSQLAQGSDFDALARQRSLDTSTRPAGGDLGWFTRGYLLVGEVEQAAFELEPGETSEIIQSKLGYHIVQTLAREERTPTPEIQQRLQDQAVEEWLDAQRDSAVIEIYVTP